MSFGPRLRLLAAFLAIVASWSTSVAAQGLPERPQEGLLVGDRFPALVLPALTDGRPVSIRDFRGRKVILHVFASW